VPASGITGGVSPTTLAIVPGPHLEALPRETANALAAAVWTVSAQADRVGLRLEGVPLPGAAALDLVSLPMLPGAVQLPPGGLPIVLMPDAPTIGGYPVPAVVAESDRPITGQLRPGDSIGFTWIDHEEARRRSRERAAGLRAVMAELR
jgi:allophanate hydrolase subunit 2